MAVAAPARFEPAARRAVEALEVLGGFGDSARIEAEADVGAVVRWLPADAADEQLEAEKRRLWTAFAKLRDAVRQLVRDDYWQGRILAVELLDRTLELETRLESELPEDAEWRVRETAADMQQLLEAMREEREHDELEDPPAAAHYLSRTFGSAEQSRLADLLGVDVRTVRAWRSGPPTTLRKRPERVVTLAHVVGELIRSLTPRGVVLWLGTPHPHLEGRTPKDLLGDPAARDALMAAARGTRGQLAA
jgi:hypothetical protein